MMESKIIYDVEQGTDEWLQMRLGKLTASRFSDVISKGRGSAPSKTRESYMYQLAAEILTEQPQDSFKNSAMDWGNECEPAARAAYELKHDTDVIECAFIEKNEWLGVSPDGLVGEDGLLEIKCPNTTTQIKRFLSGEFPKEYMAQVQGQLWVSGREWCDFVSYDPRINGDSDYFEVRVYRDEEYIENLASKCEDFIAELKQLLIKL
ncbi:MAG: YqaJ viral recombinase family protein [Desulfobulbaceae bacterium]|nr:YqaJ viral recombinase family protein [Desulfobulbaceae bacterium]